MLVMGFAKEITSYEEDRGKERAQCFYLMSKEEGKLDISFGEGALEIGMLNKLQKKNLL